MDNNLSAIPNEIKPSWKRFSLAIIAGIILLQVAIEFYQAVPVSGTIAGRFSWKWGLGYLALAGVLALLLALALAQIFKPQRFNGGIQRLISLRQRSPALFVGIAVFTALVPPAAFLLPWLRPPSVLEAFLIGPYFRLLVCLASAAIIAFGLTKDTQKTFHLQPFLAGLIIVGAMYILYTMLNNVNNYPFTLTWSEGNRLFEYSLRITPEQYNIADPDTPRNAGAGREILWGAPFLIPEAPIWVHRAWDSLLWLIPGACLGYALAVRISTGRAGRWLFAGWVLIFISQGPIYAPLVLSAALIAAMVWPGRRWLALAGAPLADYYAAASRWTWLPAPAAWAGIILLDDFNLQPGESILKSLKRLAPIAVFVAVSLLGGMLANSDLFSPQTLTSGAPFAQPLLWRRLLPNINYPEGLIFGLILAAGPVCALLVWLALSKRWKINWIQATAYVLICAVFLIGGMTVSVKIGGGNNLHNLDMFLLSAAFLTALALNHVELRITAWPERARVLLLLACLLPAWKAARLQRPSELPPVSITQDALTTISNRVSKAARRGEVLFIDQRQLFTFGHLPDIPLVTAYEKRYMMDKAMANDSEYFQGFYRDLANKRFTLIVVEPLYENIQNDEYGFQEENNTWVKWVSKPLLCFYAPSNTMGEVRTQLLTPRATPEGCEAYLHP